MKRSIALLIALTFTFALATPAHADSLPSGQHA